MTSTFPRARRNRLGYDIDEVEEFLAEARSAYTAEPGAGALDAERIRHTAFSMRKGGYAPDHVDAALERLEDAFANRERDAAIQTAGDAAWYGQARDTAQVLLDRFVRPPGHRFTRVSWFTVGYATKEVDALADRIANYFQTGQPVTIEEIRTSVFHAQRGGYQESQVDAVLDAATRTILAVR
ncbi:DivIVA domain-containing protein [Homoserinibacter sp. YIM 151385]|uniref:DivIVA domain-containing protein n=1 Tax=Homoserinibacter sp. YIM 151385 TaxID=2985506 RepID=UPI0022EFDD0C|nr:DivIVA domain-containing protein [Homoserinibacter sp. YIM 151385]WBU39159.1 DivIVA domain-containing protein [Homoserinibacter sp. YIM 151385]